MLDHTQQSNQLSDVVRHHKTEKKRGEKKQKKKNAEEENPETLLFLSTCLWVWWPNFWVGKFTSLLLLGGPKCIGVFLGFSSSIISKCYKLHN
jgi:hypothetical protein